jgi:uncharacterized lipoprotein
MPAMLRRLRPLFVSASVLLALLLAACSSLTPAPKIDMFEEYGNTVRWSDWDLAWNFVDPATRGALALPQEELERLSNYKVTGYNVRLHEPQPDGTVKQIVDIRYVEQATQIERSFRDRQIWRTDDNGEHWWLTTGLPAF